MQLNGAGLADTVTLEVSRALRRGSRRFVVDLTAAADIDSVMLRSLILAHKQVRGLEGRVVFACAEAPKRLLYITGLDSFMDVVETREEALARLET